DRSPTHLTDRQIALLARRGRSADEPCVDFSVTRRMFHRGTDAVKPGALVHFVWRDERRAVQLLGIEAEFDLLRGIAPDRQSAGKRLGLEGVAEAGHVAGD